MIPDFLLDLNFQTLKWFSAPYFMAIAFVGFSFMVIALYNPYDMKYSFFYFPFIFFFGVFCFGVDIFLQAYSSGILKNYSLGTQSVIYRMGQSPEPSPIKLRKIRILKQKSDIVGRVDCEDLTFRECVLEISKDKDLLE